MKFKLEFTFDISDSSLLIDANGCGIPLFRWGYRRYDEVTIKKL